MIRRLLPIVAVALGVHAAEAQQTLTILHTNDVHDRYEPISGSDSTCAPDKNAAGECLGGTARLVTALAAARARNPDALFLDGGDQFQGSLFYTFYKGRMTAEVMNKLGYDAMTLGNHEFDDGPAVLRDFVEAVAFPVLMANGDVSAEPLLAGRIPKSTVIERAGMRIGLIGLAPQSTDELASPGPNVTFSDPVGAVQAEVDALTAQGIDRIVVLSHSGYTVEKRLAAETTGVDVIVGGHSHSYLSSTDDAAEGPYPTMVGKTAIVSAQAYGKYLGELTVVFDDAGEVVSATGAPLLLDASVAEDAATVARIAELAGPLEEIRSRVVAEAAGAIDGRRELCRSAECPMGNLIADAMLDRVRDQGIQIAIQNGGGIRASIDAGPVTMGEVLTVLPFQNTLSTFRVTGAVVLAALENGLSQIEEGAGRFPQVAGLTYAFDAGAPAGARVSDVRVDEGDAWMPLDPAKVYGVVSNNYVRRGGDGYAMFVDAADAYDFGPDLADVTAAYLAGSAPYTPRVDGRITAK